MEEDLIFKKATLALGGGVLLPPGFQVPVRVSHSTAGPGAGSSSAAFRFDRFRVKKSISYDEGEFELHQRDDGSLFLTHRGEPFLDDVSFETVVHHCPGQSFFTIDPRCGYRCAFCASPRLPRDDSKYLSDEEIANRAREAHDNYGTVAVSLTSGVPDGNVEAEVDRFVSCITAVRRAVPGIAIGVEPYVTCDDHMRRLKEAGADEIKINVQAATPDLLRKVCPDFDRDVLLNCLRSAVRYFGRGHVTSNLIFGLGESDEELESCLRDVCETGAVPMLRPLRYNGYNREPLAKTIGNPVRITPERMVEVARMHKSILEEYGLTTETFTTMCIECGCCDLVPFRDL